MGTKKGAPRRPGVAADALLAGLWHCLGNTSLWWVDWGEGGPAASPGRITVGTKGQGLPKRVLKLRVARTAKGDPIVVLASSLTLWVST